MCGNCTNQKVSFLHGPTGNVGILMVFLFLITSWIQRVSLHTLLEVHKL